MVGRWAVVDGISDGIEDPPYEPEATLGDDVEEDQDDDGEEDHGPQGEDDPVNEEDVQAQDGEEGEGDDGGPVAAVQFKGALGVPISFHG